MKPGGVSHHVHKRKRVHVLKEKFPHPDNKVRFLDKLVTVIAFLVPIATIPQIWKLWVGKTAEGLSLFSWSLFMIFSIPMLTYGIVHKEKPLIIMYSLLFIAHIFMVVGILIY
tara:strand:+ start:76 stop:414 length:339 start_codon:yes stop_codon:yes gene_type:complete